MKRIVTLALGAALAGSSCNGFDAAEGDWSARLRDHHSGYETATYRGILESESEFLDGVYSVALAVQRVPGDRIHLQLFPEIGGKILDLQVTPKGLHGVFPHTGESIEVDLERDRPLPRHLLVMMGLTVAQHHLGSFSGTVVGQRPHESSEAAREDGGWDLLLQSRLPGLRIVAVLDSDLRLIGHDYCLRGARWQERFLKGSVIVSADGLWLRIEREAVEER